MKKIFFSGIFLALLFIVACNKDEYTEKDATNAQLDLIRYQIQLTRYAIHLIIWVGSSNTV
jgi:hypothetical protein